MDSRVTDAKGDPVTEDQAFDVLHDAGQALIYLARLLKAAATGQHGEDHSLDYLEAADAYLDRAIGRRDGHLGAGEDGGRFQVRYEGRMVVLDLVREDGKVFDNYHHLTPREANDLAGALRRVAGDLTGREGARE